MAAKKCLICNCAFRGRADAKTCSPRCRKRLQQVRFALGGADYGQRNQKAAAKVVAQQVAPNPNISAYVLSDTKLDNQIKTGARGEGLGVSKPDTSNQKLGTSSRTGKGRKLLSLILLGLFGFISVFLSATPQRANAITASTNLNFQARLLNASGAVVPDGVYNIDFKIYNTNGTTGTVGTCTGACLWEETRKVFNTQGVTVTNGYFSVNLGSVTAFPSTINWQQQLYLTMNITTNGTQATNPISTDWNGEMLNSGNSVALTSVPLAFRANQLSVVNNNFDQVLQFATGSFAQATTISLPDPGASTATVCYQNASACGFALSSGSGNYIQNSTGGPQAANFNIISSAAGNTSTIHAHASQSVDIFDINNNTSTVYLGVSSNGSLSVSPATAGTITLGTTSQTGAINVGQAQSSNQTVNIESAAGTASTQTVEIGGGTSTTSGGKVVNIANGTPGASTTNTIAIGTGGSTTGTVGITIGSATAAGHTLLLQGGNGTIAGTAAVRIQANPVGDIQIGAPSTSGVVSIGGSSQTGTITLGQYGGSSTSIINIGASAGATTTQQINIGSSATGINTLTIGSTSSSSGTTIKAGSTGLSLNAATTTASGNLVVQGTTGLTFNTGAGGDITFANNEKISNDTNGQINLSADSGALTLLLTGTAATIQNSAGALGVTGAAALNLASSSNNNIALNPNGTGDVVISQAAGSGLQINSSAAATVDLAAISTNGNATTTAGTDGLDITFAANGVTSAATAVDALHITPSYTGGATDAITFNGLEFDAFSPTNASGTDTINGIKLGNLTDPGASITSNALTIGTGWDKQINGNGWSVDGTGNLTVTSCTGCSTGSTLAASYTTGSSSTDQTLLLSTGDGGGVILKDNASSVGTAFQVQTSGSANIFSVDATNSQINVQGSTSVATLSAEQLTQAPPTNNFSVGPGTYWTLGTGWGSATTTAVTATSATGNLVTTAADLTVSTNTTYLISYNIGSYSGTGTVKPYIGGVGGVYSQGNGARASTITTTGATTQLTFTPSGSFSGIISNVSVKIITISTPVVKINNSDASVGLEIRSGGSAKLNTFIGIDAGRSTTGVSNTAVGYQTLMNNVSGINNTAVGTWSLYSNSTGSWNTAFGYQAMYYNTTGQENTAFGLNALEVNTSGSSNVAIGLNALQNSNADENTAVGYNSQYSNSSNTGSGNTSLGRSSLFNNNLGSNNTAIGNYALSNVDGTGNTSIGFQAGNNISSGTNNTFVGYNSGYQDPSVSTFRTANGLQNATAIGYGAQVQQSNSIVLGSVGTVASNLTPNIGIGTTAPTNLFSVSPDIYDTGTAYQDNGSAGVAGTIIHGTGTTWTNNMVGQEFIFATTDGASVFKETITGFTNSTTLAGSVSQAVGLVGTQKAYRIHNPAFYVSSTGSVASRTSTNSTTAFQVQNAAGSNLLTADTVNSRIGISNAYAVMTTPASPAASAPTLQLGVAVTPTGGTGSTTYNYIVISNIATGQSSASAAGTTATGVATLSSTTYNALSWTAYGSSTGYLIYRTVGGTTQGLIGTVPSGTTTFNDTGITAGGRVPTATGALANSTQYFYKVTAIDSAGGETAASTEVNATTGAAGANPHTINISWTATTGASGYRVYRGTSTGGEVYLTTVQTNYFTDVGAIAIASGAPPSVSTAYISSNNSNNLNQISIGGNGTPAGQLYVSGVVPTSYLGQAKNCLTNPVDVFVQGRYAYVADSGSCKLAIFDVSNPASPQLASSLTTGLTSPTSVYVAGKYAYVTDFGGNKLAIVDVSNPTSPTLTGSTTSGLSGPESVFVQGRYAYVANNTVDSLAIYDISNPSNPILIGSNVNGLSNPFSVFIQGRYAYIANSGGKLAIFDVSNPASPALASSTTSGLTNPQSVYIQGHYAYVADGAGKLVTFDVSNPASPALVSSISTGLSTSQDVFIQGRYAYIAEWGNSKLSIFDISNPASPISVGSTTSGLSGPWSIFVQGRYAYMIDNNNDSLVTFDLGGTYTQQLEAGGAEFGTLSVGGNAQVAGDQTIQGGTSIGQSLQVNGNIGTGGNLTVQGTGSINVTYSLMTTPASPAASAPTLQLGVTATPTGGTGSTTYNYIVISTIATGQSSASVAGTTATGVASLSSTQYNALSWTAYGSSTGYLIYRTVGGTTQGLIGTVPSGTTTFNDTGITAGGRVPTATGALANSTQYFYKVTAIDSAGGETAASTEVNATTGAAGANPHTINVSWTATTGASGYKVYRSTTTNTEVYLTTVNTNYFTDVGAITAGTGSPPSTNTAYTSANNSSSNLQLTVGGLGTPTGQLYVSGVVPSSYLGTTSTGLSNPHSVYVLGNYAYVANTSNNTLGVVDISNPAMPNRVGSVATASGPISVYAQGAYAYVVSSTSSTLGIFNISNPSAPVSVGSTTSGLNSPQGIFVVGRYAYVASNANSSFVVFDISNPSAPVSVGSTTTGLSLPRSVFVQGRYAYIADSGNSSLIIIDINNPASPTYVGTTNIGLSGAYAVYVQGRYAYVANNGNNKLSIFDVSNPSAPVSVGSTTTGLSSAQYLYVQGRYAYVSSNGNSAIVVFDVSNPSAPTSVGSITSGLSFQYGLFVQGRYAYVASGGNDSLVTFDLGGTYTQQLEAGGAEFGTLAVDSNSMFAGNVNIQGGTTIGQSLNINGNFTASGSLITLNGGSTGELGAWNSTSTLGANRDDVVSLVANGYAYAIGGSVSGSGGPYQTTSYYSKINANGTLATWNTTTALPEARWAAKGVYANGYIYVLGGHAGGGSGARSTALYAKVNSDGTLGNWQTSPNALPAVRYDGAAFAYNGYVYYIGGAPDSGTPQTNVYYAKLNSDGTTGAWNSATSLSAARMSTVAVTANGFVYLIGGHSGGAPLSTLVYNSINADGSLGGTWTSVNLNGTAQRKFTSAAVANGYLYVIGGTDGSSSFATASYAQLNNNGSLGSWITNTTTLPSTRNEHSSFISNGYIYVVGGGASNTVYYSSTPRVQLGGSLDLVGLTNADLNSSAGDSSTGSLGGNLTAGNTKIIGSLEVMGQANIAQSLAVGGLVSTGSLNVAGQIPTSALSTTNLGIGVGPQGIQVQGRYAYIANYSGNGLNIYDISNPSNPSSVGNVSTGASTGPNNLFVAGRYVYMSLNTTGALQIIDVSNPLVPVLAGSASTGGAGAYDVYVQGSYAYVTNRTLGSLSIFDVTNAYKPVKVSTYTQTGSVPQGIQVQGKYAYVTFNNSTFQIFDISNPANPIKTGSYTVSSNVTDLYVQGNYAYTINSGNGTMYIIDISNPYAPTVANGAGGTSLVDTAPTYIYVQGKYAYITQYSAFNHLQVWDISNPANPAIIGQASTGTSPNGLWVQGRYAYVVNFNGGVNGPMQIFDLGGAYTQQLEAGGIDAGTLNVTADSTFNGNITVNGGLNIAQNTSIAGGLTVSPSADNLSGFSVADKLGNPIIKVNTAATGNLLAEGNFEDANTTNTNGWSKYNGAETQLLTAATNPTIGSRTLQVTTTTGNTQGVKYAYQFKPNTTYTLSGYLSLSSNNSGVTTVVAQYGFGANVNGSDATCTSGNSSTSTLTINTTPTKYTCTFTTGATVLATDFIFARKNTDASIRSIHLDAVQLELGSSPTSFADPGFSLSNLVSNPSLENGNINGWGVSSAGAGAVSLVDTATTGAKFGNNSLKFVTTSSNNDAAKYTMPLLPNTQYSITMWAKASSGTPAFTLGREEVNTTSLNCGSGFNLSTTWQQFTCTTTTGATITPPSGIYIRNQSGAIQTIYIDGVTVVQAAQGLAFANDADNLQIDSYLNNITLNGGNSGDIQPWRLNANALPDTSAMHGTAVANGYVYITGGRDNSGSPVFNSVWYAKLNADGSTGSWNVSSNSLPSARYSHGSMVINNYLYVIGGVDGSFTGVSTVYYAKINPVDGSVGAWQTTTSLPAVRYDFGSTAANGYIYVVSGTAGGGGQSTVYYTKPNVDGSIANWSVTGQSITGVSGNSAIAANGYLYSIGGDNGSVSSSVYAAPLNADGTTGAFSNTNTASMPAPRKYTEAGVVNGYLYAIGGYNTAATNTVFYSKLTPGGNSAWSTSAYSLPAIRNVTGGFVSANGYIYNLGGSSDNAATNLSTVYYTSVARTLVGGSLDLVGLSGGYLSDAIGGDLGSMGGTLTAGNTQIVGSLQVSGQAAFGQNVGIAGSATVGGSGLAVVPNIDSTSGFSISDIVGNKVINVNTTTTKNLLQEGNFESTSGANTGWTSLSGFESSLGAVSDAGHAQYGSQSLKVLTSSGVSRNEGTAYKFPFKPNTTYTFSAYVSLAANGGTNFGLGANVNGSDVTCASGVGSGIAFSTTIARYTCTFTTTAVQPGNDYAYVRRGTGDTVQRTIYIDGAQLEQGGAVTNYTDPGFSLSNLVSNPSFENGANIGNYWAQIGGGGNGVALVDNATTGAQYGNSSLKVGPLGTSGQGAAYYGWAPTASTQYTLSMWVKTASANTTTFALGYDSGSGNNSCSNITPGTTWTQYTCTFTSGSTIGALPYIYLKETATAATPNTYIDGVTLVQAGQGLAFANDGSNIQVDNLLDSIILNGGNNGEIQPWKAAPNQTSVGHGRTKPCVLNGYVYEEDNGTSEYAKIYPDGSIGSWASIPTADANQGTGQCAVSNGYLFWLGGNSSGNNVYSAKPNLDGTITSWKAINNLPGNRGSASVTTYNGYIYVVGGNAGGSNQSTIYFSKVSADGTVGAWSATTLALPAVSQYTMAVALNGYMYVIGGTQTASPTSISNVYYAPITNNGDITAGSWSNGSSLPAGRSVTNVVVVNGYIYIIAGDVTAGTATTATNTVFYAKANGDGSVGVWNTSAYSLPTVLEGPTIATANGYIYVINGINTAGSGVKTIYYTSTARVLVSGGLDLVGLSSASSNSDDIGSGSAGGTLTAGNTRIIGSIDVSGQASIAGGVSAGGLTSNGDIAIGAQPNNSPHNFSSTCNCMVNTTAGTYGSQSSIDGVKYSAIYKGKLYVSTSDTALNNGAVYRYDGGGVYTLVTNTPGKVIAADPGDWDTGMLTVYNGKLYLGAQTGNNTGALYSYDGTTWTLINTTRGTIGADTNIDGIGALNVWNGQLYITTVENDLSGIYRYDGGTAAGGNLTRLNATLGKGLAEATATIDAGSLVNYGGNLWWGTQTFNGNVNAAAVYKYDGNTFTLMNTTLGTFETGTANVDDVTKMIVYQDQLIIGTGEYPDGGNIYVFKGGYDGGAGASVFKKMNYATGTMINGDTTGIDAISGLGVYNGRLYAGTRTFQTTTNAAALYEYIGTDSGGTANWQKVNGTSGTFGAQTAVDAVWTINDYNGTMYVGTQNDSGTDGSMYTWNKTSDQSYGLKFSSTDGNTASISFVGNQQVSGNSFNTGSFVFTHGIMSTAGSYDVAEDYPTLDDTLQPGDLVTIDPDNPGMVKRATGLGDNALLGIYSEKPGLRLSQQDQYIGEGTAIPVALAGRVPVNISDENGPVVAGDYLTSSSTPGVAMKANRSGITIGKALEGFSGPGTGKILAFVNVSYYAPTTLSMMQSVAANGSTLTSVDGNLSIGMDLTVGGGLTVGGEAKFNGNAFFYKLVTFVEKTVFNNDVTFAGHVTTAGTLPTVTLETGAGITTAPPDNPNAKLASQTNSGNDNSGKLSLTIGDNATAGEVLTVKFDKPFSDSPNIFLTPTNQAAAGLKFYLTSDKDGFKIIVTDPPAAGTTLNFSYLVIQ